MWLCAFVQQWRGSEISLPTGLDQLTHALESITALPYYQRPAPETPKMRPAYQGANPITFGRLDRLSISQKTEKKPKSLTRWNGWPQ